MSDSDGNTPSVKVDLTLTSDEMNSPVVINPDTIDDGTYFFNALYSANYTLKIKYNSF